MQPLRKIIVVLVAAVGVVVVAGCADHAANKSAAPANSQSSTNTPSSPDGSATKDVRAYKWLRTIDGFNYQQARVEVHNRTTKRCDYRVDLALVSPDGTVRYSTTVASFEAVEPDELTKQVVTFMTGPDPNDPRPLIDGSVDPDDAVVKITAIKRTPSF